MNIFWILYFFKMLNCHVLLFVPFVCCFFISYQYWSLYGQLLRYPYHVKLHKACVKLKMLHVNLRVNLCIKLLRSPTLTTKTQRVSIATLVLADFRPTVKLFSDTPQKHVLVLTHGRCRHDNYKVPVFNFEFVGNLIFPTKSQMGM